MSDLKMDIDTATLILLTSRGSLQEASRRLSSLMGIPTSLSGTIIASDASWCEESGADAVAERLVAAGNDLINSGSPEDLVSAMTESLILSTQSEDEAEWARRFGVAAHAITGSDVSVGNRLISISSERFPYRRAAARASAAIMAGEI